MTRGEFTMMHTKGIQSDIEDFMRAVGQGLPATPQSADPATLQLRIDLITEEFDEIIYALTLLQSLDPLHTPGQTSKATELALLAEVADGIADLVYVAIGTASALGIDMEPVWEEVQRSNMAKVSGPIREDGKRLKPEGWSPPQIERVIREQVAEADFADRPIG